MAIQPVKYRNDSSTEGFAEAGDTIAITSNNANTIKKDVDQGNTESLNNAQQRWLDKWVDEDTLDYSDEEMQKVGENQIDTKGEDGEDLSEKNGKGGAVAASGATVAAGLSFALSALTGVTTKKGISLAADGWSQLALAIATTIMAGVTVATSLTFDPNKEERKNQTNNAAANNTILQQYTDQMNSDMDSMTEESGTYAELSDMTTQMTMDSITNVGALQAEMQVYQAQGNTEKVAELKAQIEELQGNSEKELEEPKKEMDTIKENLEQYTGNNAEAQGVSSSGATVAEFLQDGHGMKVWSDVNMYALMLCAVVSAATATGIMPKIAPFFPDLSGNLPAKISYAASAALFLVAANNMKKTSDIEGDAGSAGDEMSGYVASLNENIEGQAGFTEEATAGYLETDEASAETTDKTQQETDKANQKQGEALAGQQKPEEDKPEPEEENPEVAAGGGAGAGGAAA